MTGLMWLSGWALPRPVGAVAFSVSAVVVGSAEALAVLMAGNGLPPLLKDAVSAAKRRAEELSG